MTRYYTVKTFAEKYGKSERTVRRWIASSKIEAKKDPGGRDWIIVIKDDRT